MNNLDKIYNKIMNEDPPKIIRVVLQAVSHTVFRYNHNYDDSGPTFKTGYTYGKTNSSLTLGHHENKLAFKKAVVEAYFNEEMSEILAEPATEGGINS